MYLTYLLSSGELTKAEVYVCITELLLGGVDTVRGELVAAAHTQRSLNLETRFYSQEAVGMTFKPNFGVHVVPETV